MESLGTPGNPLRVAIIGSGPAAFYAADHLQKQNDVACRIDMYDKLPTPYGLVRGGVAPDHQKIKSVTKVYDKIASHPSFRFFGNVEIGRDVRHDELLHYYHGVIYAVGAQSDRRMGIAGEDLPGSHAATEFVAWYNGHPEYVHFKFDLTQENVAVVGNGNVAMDVARILASSYDELAKTDIANYALEALKHSRVKTIYLLGRRGPAQAAFTNTEIKELGEMADADIIVSPEDERLDELSKEHLAKNPDAGVQRNVEILHEFSKRQPTGKPKQIIMKFLVSPDALTGKERVESVVLRHNVLKPSDDGSLRPKSTDRTEIIPAGLVFRSIGYKGTPLAGLPFDEKNGTVPNDHGRVWSAGHAWPGVYVAGWIKRGPSGVIGTNKPDAVETANKMIEDMKSGILKAVSGNDILPLLSERKIRFFTFPDWQKLDKLEQGKGQASGRPRVKFTTVDEMWNAIH
jgi:ferredoxin--NADP+ reductase